MIRLALVAMFLSACGDNVPGNGGDDGGGGDGVLCRSNGLCVEHPAPLDVPLLAVTTGQAGDVWAASTSDVLHWDGKGLHYERARSRDNRQLRIASIVVGGTAVYALASTPDSRPAVMRRTRYSTWEIVDDLHDATTALTGRDGDAWALTAGEHVMHLEAGDWIDKGALPAVRSMVANGPTEVWATMHDGRIAHYDGSVWKTRGRSPVTFSIRSVVGTFDECWIVTARDEVMHMKVDDMDPDRKPKIELSLELAPGFAASAVVGRSLSDIWMFGYDRGTGTPRMLHSDGMTWTEMALPVVGRVFAATLAGDQLVTAGTAGEITRDADRQVTSTRAPDAPIQVRTVAVAPGTSDVWGVDPTGALAHRSDDATWHVVGESRPARDLFVRTAGEPWVLDHQGSLRWFDGATFVDSGLPYVYYACAQPGGGVVANTGSGTFVSTDGRTFTAEPPVPYTPLFCPADGAVWGAYFARDALGTSRLYPQAGSRGVAAGTEEMWITTPFSRTVTNLDGGLWRTFDDLLGGDGWIGDVAASSSENVWIVGAHGRAVTFDGVMFVRHDTGIDETLVSVQTVSATDVSAVGEAGTIIHWDGASWTVTGASAPIGIRDAHVFSTTNAVAVGGDGHFLTYDGTQWNAGADVFGASMEELQVVSTSDMWALDAARSHVWHFDGTAWTDTGGVGTTISALSVSGTRVHVLSYDGQISRFDGTAWLPTTFIPNGFNGSLVPRGDGTQFVVGSSTGYLDDGVTVTPIKVAYPIIDARAGTDGRVRLADAYGRLWRVTERVTLIGEPTLPRDVYQLESAMVLDDTHAWAVGYTWSGERRLLKRDRDLWISVLEASERPGSLQPVSMDASSFAAWFATSDGRVLRSP